MISQRQRECCKYVTQAPTQTPTVTPSSMGGMSSDAGAKPRAEKVITEATRKVTNPMTHVLLLHW